MVQDSAIIPQETSSVQGSAMVLRVFVMAHRGSYDITTPCDIGAVDRAGKKQWAGDVDAEVQRPWVQLEGRYDHFDGSSDFELDMLSL